MNRPLHVWIAFGACLALVLGSMGWVSATVLRLDSESLNTRRQAALEENVRLALWRLDSAVAPLVGRENARPAFAYEAFYSARWAYTRMYTQLDAGQVMVPSPLLSEHDPLIRMHFQFTPGGALTSPQAPSGNMRDLAESGFASNEEVTAATERLDALSRLLDQDELASAVGLGGQVKVAVGSAPPQIQGLGFEQRQKPKQGGNVDIQGQGNQDQQQAYQTVANRSTVPIQKAMSANEFQARNRVAQQAAVQANLANQAVQPPAQNSLFGTSGLGLNKNMNKNMNKKQARARARRPDTDRPQTSLMTAVWSEGELLMVRRAELDGRQVVQGVWLDWPAMRAELLTEVSDLLPKAKLEPLLTLADERPMSRLAAFPVQLLPGLLVSVAGSGLSPIQISLVIAWVFALLAAAAVGLVLKATVALSERRAAFVSAVTHELRTPLTTFRMYTEMLAEGMVTEETKRQRYYQTLHAEADRLDHLVQNVLAYARLERNPQARRPERIAVQAALDRAAERLAARCAQHERPLEVKVAPEASSVEVRVDTEALGRILFNLVDNAVKYGAPADDPRIHLGVVRVGQAVEFTVRDHGPGVAPGVVAHLFSPFSKTAETAAETAPGVGLGLALSRRLAHRMGGELRLEPPADGDGAQFVLRLPLAA